MKIIKLYIFIVFILLFKLIIAQSPVIVTQNGKTITIDFTLPTYQIKDINLLETCNLNETYHYIEMDDIDGEIDDLGFPDLPVHAVNLLIPSDANNFVLTSSNITSQIENLTYEIIPDLDDEKNEDFTVFTKDQSYYNSNGALYAFDCKYSNPYIIMGAKGITIHICPFQYDPLANELTVITSGTFTFTYASSLNDEMANVSERKQVFLESFFDNFDLSQSKYLLQESTIMGRYLIITPPVFEANLEDFVEHKINMGYFVDIVNTNVTGTTAAAIINYITSIYANLATRPDFLLLVGDVNNIPASMGDATGNTKNDPISDLYYGAVDGNDLFADIHVGRFSVATNAELQNIIDKTIFMENNIINQADRIALLAGAGLWKSYFHPPHNKVCNELSSYYGYTCEKVYQYQGNNKWAALAALDNNPRYYVYSGHGGRTRWAWRSNNNEFIGAADINNATNSVFPFVFAFACHTGNFAFANSSTVNLSICETWIRTLDIPNNQDGSVSYFGCSVESHPRSDPRIEKKILKYAFINHNRLKEMIDCGMNLYYGGSITKKKRKRYIKAYNLLGDPSIFVRKSCPNNYFFFSNKTFHNNTATTYHTVNGIIASYTGSPVTLNSGSFVTFIAGNDIKLSPNFHASAGSEFHAYIFDFCTTTSVKKSLPRYSNNENNSSSEVIQVNIDNDMLVFPNPFNNKINIDISSVNSKLYSLKIFNITGKLVYENNCNNLSNTDIISINTSKFLAGMYICKIETKDKVFIHKIIKVD